MTGEYAAFFVPADTGRVTFDVRKASGPRGPDRDGAGRRPGRRPAVAHRRRVGARSTTAVVARAADNSPLGVRAAGRPGVAGRRRQHFAASCCGATSERRPSRGPAAAVAGVRAGQYCWNIRWITAPSRVWVRASIIRRIRRIRAFTGLRILDLDPQRRVADVRGRALRRSRCPESRVVAPGAGRSDDEPVGARVHRRSHQGPPFCVEVRHLAESAASHRRGCSAAPPHLGVAGPRRIDPGASCSSPL